MSNDKLLDKLQKLFNLSTSSNANEAALALEKAAELMAAHNLTKGDIARRQIGEVMVKSMHSVSNPKDWEAALAELVGQAFGCSLMWRPGYSHNKDYWGRYVFVGEKSQLPLVEYTFTVLQRQLTKQRADFTAEIKRVWFNHHGTTKVPAKTMTEQLDGFAKGWVRTILPKVHAFSNSPEVQATIDEHVKAEVDGRVKEPDNRGNGSFGWAGGVKAAADVNIHRPMDAEEQKLIGG